MRVDVWSDVVCPWCYLGKKRLDAALDRVGRDGIDVHWRAYQLDPTATREPKDLRRAIDAKYGPGAFENMSTRLTALGEEVGIDYRFDIAKRVSSLDALRLVAWADQTAPEAVDDLHERLFRAYFTEGHNIADPDTLGRLAADVGLDDVAAQEALAAGFGRDEVVADLQAAAERSVTGVPAFVIQDAFMIPGAQDIDTMANLLSKARERLAELA